MLLYKPFTQFILSFFSSSPIISFSFILWIFFNFFAVLHLKSRNKILNFMMGHMSPAGLKIMMVFYYVFYLYGYYFNSQISATNLNFVGKIIGIYYSSSSNSCEASIKVHLNYLYLEKLWIDCFIYWLCISFIDVIGDLHEFFFFFFSVQKYHQTTLYIIKKRLNLDEVLEMNLYISLIRVFGIYIFRLSLLILPGFLIFWFEFFFFLKFSMHIYIYKHSHF